MALYSEYLDNPLLRNDFNALTAERKKQLKRISSLRGNHDILVFAADFSKGSLGGQTAISYPDILPITDQLSNLKGKHLDLVLETPGGFAEVTEDIVRLVRQKYDSFAVIVAGWAKSAGTILAMAADEVLMGPSSALGPIDAQLIWQNKQFSADALLEGVKKIDSSEKSVGEFRFGQFAK
jgi:ClpP class serine protease